MEESKLYDLVLCVGEATTNAIKHADMGRVSVHKRDGALLVRVSDSGPGIQEINLPDVALKRGYTTAISLGMGYKAMISIADRVYLATGPTGTTVAIEMSLHPKEKEQPVPGLPGAWQG
jgi:anti-sigma regulatory factor (Ser/Thr protein kinase)